MCIAILQYRNNKNKNYEKDKYYPIFNGHINAII